MVDAIWDAFAEQGVSWVGFYLFDESQPAETPLVLGPRRDSPACSPIGLHGVCGQAFAGRMIRIVDDVALLGADYIACDPRDISEIVLPACDGDRVWGVLDLDSRSASTFDETDARALTELLFYAGLSSARDLPVSRTHVPD
ncbi:MAG: GAF domain-containing protein [Phycisphaerales bacterium]|nr:GAF domain-containing protein [Phycisphaerales bacterium]